ncbi:hypothetical protein CEK60_21790 [Halomonas sp. N3-2A]|nr:hypothetical protein CEK60_21790 [Halomonas sp. N3-2A]
MLRLHPSHEPHRTDAGTYTHTASGTDGNYDLTFVDGALTIDKATATVTANSDTTIYSGGSQNVTGFTATGLVGGENASVLADVTTTGGSGTDAGTYTHTASGTDGNYDLTFVDGALTIDKATATVTANSDMSLLAVTVAVALSMVKAPSTKVRS